MNEERKKLINSVIFPLLFLIIIWLVKCSELIFHIDLSEYGILPLTEKGLTGIITAPLIHGSISHISANSAPLFLLSLGIFYFYREVAFKVFFLIYFISGLWIWVFAREAYHIGASGLIYGFGSFLFLSGIIRKDGKLMALSLLIIFLYGGMVWGILPIEKQVSWESHLMGLLAGIVIAYFYRNQGPPIKKYDWNEDNDLETEENNENEDYSIKQP